MMGVNMGVEPSRDCKSLSLGSFKVMGMNNLKFAGVAIDKNKTTKTTNNKQQTNKQTNRDLLCCEVTDVFSFLLSLLCQENGKTGAK